MLTRPNKNQVPAKERQRVIQNITIYGMLMDIVLSAAKIAGGLVFHSTALIADGIHSLSDMVTDVFVLIINRISHTEPDEDHPYGHARFETAGTLILGIALISVAIGMLIEYGSQLVSENISTQPSYWALIIVLCSLAGKEWQFRFTLAAAKRVRSKLMEANAWHSRGDAFSSLVVLIGVIGTLAGFPDIEILAALFVSYLIGKMGLGMLWGSLQELMDKGLTPDDQEQLKDCLIKSPGILRVHMFRTRRMSSHILLDAHIQVAPDISVSEGHQINEYAMQRLREKEPDLRDITLHIDHESDDLKCNWQLAPLRPEIEQHIQSKSALAGYESVTIHYDHQFIRVDLVYNKMPDDRMKTACKALVSETNWLLSAKLYYSSFTEEIGLDEKIQQTSPGNTS